MSDIISRRDAIEALNIISDKMSRSGQVVIENAIAIIEDLCSTELEQKKGKWKRRKYQDCWECSECHAVLEDDDIKNHNFYYCYHCGANMMTLDGWVNIE